MKAGKRIVFGNTNSDGSLNNDKAARAIMQYRNTPIQGVGLSPAQLLLHRQLRDCVPAHPTLYKPHRDWVMAANCREGLLAERNAKLTVEYNRTAHELPILQVGDYVAIQNQVTKRWDISGLVVEVLPNRQYRIRVDGSGRVTLRNRRFMKKILMPRSQIIPSADTSCLPPCANPIRVTLPIMPRSQIIPSADTSHNTSPCANRIRATLPITAGLNPHAVSFDQSVITPGITTQNRAPPKLPRQLARLSNFNKVGLNELGQPGRIARREGRGRYT